MKDESFVIKENPPLFNQRDSGLHYGRLPGEPNILSSYYPIMGDLSLGNRKLLWASSSAFEQCGSHIKRFGFIFISYIVSVDMRTSA